VNTNVNKKNFEEVTFVNLGINSFVERGFSEFTKLN
jgi:hypothetical protein